MDRAEGDRHRHQRHARDGKDSNEVRYYILSKYLRHEDSPQPCVDTGASKTACIGNSTSRFRKINAASAKATPTRTSASSAAPH